MAVTLDRAGLALALNIITDVGDAIPAGQAAVLDRLLAVAKAEAEAYSPDAPAAAQNEAVVRLAGFLLDMPPEDNRAQNPFRASGAMALLAQHRSVRLAGLAVG